MELFNVWRRTKPKRPFKSLADFRIRQFYHARHNWLDANPDKWPCLGCHGWGQIYDPNDPPDPIEGSKYRRLLPCPDCGGKGYGPKSKVVQAYRKVIAKYEAEKGEYERLSEAREAALKRLTKPQIQALKELGV